VAPLRGESRKVKGEQESMKENPRPSVFIRGKNLFEIFQKVLDVR
jgi:hypothetical protein